MQRDLAMQALLTEFSKLRDEIQRRSEAQDRLQILLAATAGVVLPLAVQQRPQLLVCLSFVASLTGLAWADHAIQIKTLGGYIRDVIEREVRQLAGPRVMQWEHWFRGGLESADDRAFRRIVGIRVLKYALPGLFIVTGLAGLCGIPFAVFAGAPDGRLPSSLIVWLIEILAFLMFLAMLVGIIMRWTLRRVPQPERPLQGESADRTTS